MSLQAAIREAREALGLARRRQAENLQLAGRVMDIAAPADVPDSEYFAIMYSGARVNCSAADVLAEADPPTAGKLYALFIEHGDKIDWQALSREIPARAPDEPAPENVSAPAVLSPPPPIAAPEPSPAAVEISAAFPAENRTLRPKETGAEPEPVAAEPARVIEVKPEDVLVRRELEPEEAERALHRSIARRRSVEFERARLLHQEEVEAGNERERAALAERERKTAEVQS